MGKIIVNPPSCRKIIKELTYKILPKSTDRILKKKARIEGFKIYGEYYG